MFSYETMTGTVTISKEYLSKLILTKPSLYFDSIFKAEIILLVLFLLLHALPVPKIKPSFSNICNKTSVLMFEKNIDTPFFS